MSEGFNDTQRELEILNLRKDNGQMRAALTQFVAACETAPPTSMMIEIGMACTVARRALLRSTDVAAGAQADADDWKDDPSADERWNAGLDYGMVRFCKCLGVNPKSVNWDAATEELDGDVCAVIGNILRVKFGEDWDPTTTTPQAALIEDLTQNQKDTLARIANARAAGAKLDPFWIDFEARYATQPQADGTREALQKIADTDQYPDTEDTASELREIARHALASEGKSDLPPMAQAERCPRCDSPDPARHPAMQSEGEVQICPHPWHTATAQPNQSQEPSKEEMHAISHARHQVACSSPEHPDCCFDFDLVKDLLRVIDRSLSVSRPDRAYETFLQPVSHSTILRPDCGPVAGSSANVISWIPSKYVDGPNDDGYFSAGIDIPLGDHGFGPKMHDHAIEFHCKDHAEAVRRRDIVMRALTELAQRILEA